MQLRKPVKERRDIRIAKAHHVQNVKTCKLYSFPQELLDIINDCLDATDHLSLQAACRRHFTHETEVSSETRAEFRFRLNKDSLERTAKLEAGQQPGRMRRLFCSACYAKHPRSRFTQQQIYAPTRNRSCIASSGLFRVFDHLNLTFGQMRDLAIWKQEMYYVTLYTHWSHRDAEYRGGVGAKARWSDKANDCTIMTDVALSDLYPGQRLSLTELRNILLSRAAYICPHFTTANRFFFQRIREVLQMSDDLSGTDGEHISGKLDYIKREVMCGEPHCATRFALVKWCEEDTLFLTIRRQHGGLKSIMDPVWLSSIN